jgi:hypothetical protein
LLIRAAASPRLERVRVFQIDFLVEVVRLENVRFSPSVKNAAVSFVRPSVPFHVVHLGGIQVACAYQFADVAVALQNSSCRLVGPVPQRRPAQQAQGGPDAAELLGNCLFAQQLGSNLTKLGEQIKNESQSLEHERAHRDASQPACRQVSVGVRGGASPAAKEP